jgi:hypothetical protein
MQLKSYILVMPVLIGLLSPYWGGYYESVEPPQSQQLHEPYKYCPKPRPDDVWRTFATNFTNDDLGVDSQIHTISLIACPCLVDLVFDGLIKRFCGSKSQRQFFTT